MVAVAIGGAAVLGAGATIIGGSQAANAQQKGDQAAIAEQQSEFNQNRADLAPWRAAGSTALGSLLSAYGLPGGTNSGQPYGGFKQSPGYQFMLDQGEQAVDRGQAAAGLLKSGSGVKAEQRYAEGLASGDFNNYTAGLSNIAGLGQNATNTTVQAGTTAANNISNALIASGNARASSYANAASGINSGLNNAMMAYLMQSGGMFGGGGNAAGAIGLMG
jgi:hypothetical protein